VVRVPVILEGQAVKRASVSGTVAAVLEGLAVKQALVSSGGAGRAGDGGGGLGSPSGLRLAWRGGPRRLPAGRGR
jgi:hypothetical protein